MIRKIRPDEYLERYDAMSDGERRDYQKRVGEWLAGGGRRLYEITDRPMAKAQNIVQLSMRWGQDDCLAFQDGARLLSALIDKADTWLPTQLYAKGAYRAVRQMVKVLFNAQDGTGVPKGKLNGTFVKVKDTDDTVEYQYVENTDPAPRPAPTGVGSAYGQNGVNLAITEEQKQRIVDKYVKKVQQKHTAKEESAEGTSKATQAVAAASPAGKPADTVAAVPPRPTHIDQYAHLLPVATQERAKEYGPLMRQLEEARENLRLVADDPKASDKDRERWAKTVTGIDKQIGGIKRELDNEWEKLAQSGRVVVDDLGMAHVVEIQTPPLTPPLDGRGAADATDANGVKSELNSDADAQVAKEKQEQINALRRWLRDCRTSKDNQKHLKHWREKYLEMVALGGPDTVTDAVKEAAKFYGFDLAELNKNDNEKQIAI